jgi:hypothetical protein
MRQDYEAQAQREEMAAGRIPDALGVIIGKCADCGADIADGFHCRPCAHTNAILRQQREIEARTCYPPYCRRVDGCYFVAGVEIKLTRRGARREFLRPGIRSTRITQEYSSVRAADVARRWRVGEETAREIADWMGHQ